MYYISSEELVNTGVVFLKHQTKNPTFLGVGSYVYIYATPCEILYAYEPFPNVACGKKLATEIGVSFGKIDLI